MIITQRSKEAQDLTYPFWRAIERLARIEFSVITDVEPFPGQTRVESVDRSVERNQARKGSQIDMPGLLAILQLEGVIDLDAERSRLAKAVTAAEKERDSLKARLANPAFTDRAKPEAVEKARADHDARAAEAERLGAALKRLG